MKNKNFNFGDFLINFFLIAILLLCLLAILGLTIAGIVSVFQFSAVLGWLIIGFVLLVGVIAYVATVKEIF